jgi:peptidoglycan hydrolase-like protein with peptidoglycan-binding domain
VLLPLLLAAAVGAPAVTATVSQPAGQAPLAVPLAASGDAATYHWDLGDGTSADGPSVQHTYAAGLWNATVTATAPDGETAQAHVAVRAETVTLAARSPATYGKLALFTGSITPTAAGVPVTIGAGGRTLGRGTTGAGGGFRVHARAGAPGAVVARADKAASAPFELAVKPAVSVEFVGKPLDGEITVAVRIRPAGAGTLAVTVRHAGSVVKTASGASVDVALDTRNPGSVVVTASARPSSGWTSTRTTATTTIAYPSLGLGTSGAVVADLTRQLAALGYYTPAPSTTFSPELLDSVYAFQKVQGLARTGTVDAAFWTKLAHPVRPVARYTEPGDHIEVDKAKQVLYIVRNGRVRNIAPVSTAGLPGKFTPVGRFAIYRKVLGFDPSPLGTLYDPMYFVGGYAIHGNPSVPRYPASHGCVRVPMWIAPTLYDTNDYGEIVYVY